MSEPNDWNRAVIEEFRANEGKVGGAFEGRTILLLTHTGAKTGTVRVNPVAYQRRGDSYAVFASAAGAPTNPDWYHNLVANPDVQIEVGEETLAVHAVELKGEERDTQYAEQARRYPGFADYERKTTRVIPVIALIPADAKS